GGGIRDRNVTGVQPCGLPITARARCGGTLERRRRRAHQPPGHYRGRPEYERGPDVRDDRKVAVSWHDPSLSSPANGPTCPSRRWPAWRGNGATTASKSPPGETTSTRGRPPRTTRTSRTASTSWKRTV